IFVFSVVGIFLYHRLDYAFTNYVFGDAGASWHAVHLIRSGKLPGVDFAYQYGALSLGIFDASLRILGDNPQGCYAFGTLSVLVLVILQIVFAKRIRANRPALMLGFCWLLSSQRMLFLSAAHALEPLVLGLAAVAIGFQKKRLAMILCVIAWFIKPAMAAVMLSMLLIWHTFDEIHYQGKLRLFLRDLLVILLSFLFLFSITLVWLGWQSASSMVIPSQGTGVYKALNFGFFRGSGSSMWFLPGASLGYYLGTQSASWLVLNVVLCFISLVILARWIRTRKVSPEFRDPLGELTVFLFLSHTAFVCFFYGQLWSWMYYAWLLWMTTLSAITWISEQTGLKCFARRLAWTLIILSLLGNYSNARQVLASLRFDQPVESRFGLFASSEFCGAWKEMQSELNHSPACISLLIGYGEGVLGSPFFTPQYWCIAPGDTFEPMFHEMNRAIQEAEQIVLFMHENLDYFEVQKKQIELGFQRVFVRNISGNRLELWQKK
ncbi:MAG: hypothetical protein RJA81_1980, partial [Planctomycetota bacterium]